MKTAKIILSRPGNGAIGFVSWTEQELTDFELWRRVALGTLTKMGVISPQMKVGFFLDLLNSFPMHIRKALVSGIGEGLGLAITETPEGIKGTYEQRYEPLFDGPKSGLWTPS